MLQAIRVLMAGESYWKVIFTSGKQLSELDEKPIEIQPNEDIHNGSGLVAPAFLTRLAPRVRMRRVEWLEDVIGSGDIKNVKQAILCTPQGEACFTVQEPYTIFQFARGTMALDPARGTIRIKNAQIMGIVIDKDTGLCEYAAWDVQAQKLYTGHNNVNDFQAWRAGIIPIGKLNLEIMDVRGVAQA